jgi:hypothetical protein
MQRVPLLANDYSIVIRSPDPKNIFTTSPGLAKLPSGRFVATVNTTGPGARDYPAKRRWEVGERGFAWVTQIFTSDDNGKTWDHRDDFPGQHTRPFVAGNSVYVLGHGGDLIIMRSDDEGTTWSEPVRLTEGQHWHQSSCNVWYTRGNIYLVMERRLYFDVQGWPVNEYAPVLMRAPVTADLLKRESWTFASELAFRDLNPQPNEIGVPFWPVGNTDPTGKMRRMMAPIGWLETNVVQFPDPHHIWHDPTGRTFHLWMRAHTGSTGYACIAKVVEQDDGSMVTMAETAPSGQRILYVPCPGGQMRFHVLYDEQMGLYWLLSTLASDSMTRPEYLPETRYGLPNNERHVLALHFSKNMIDWRMAGVVAQGNSPKEARHYASMIFDGDDLRIMSRSGDERAVNAHDGDMVTQHIVRDFRSLVY